MSQENVEVVLRIYDAWNRWDPDAVVALFESEGAIELVLAETFRNPGPHTGTHAFQSYLAGTRTDVASIDVEQIYASGNTVAAVILLQPEKSGGKPRKYGHLWTLRDGKILSHQVFADPAGALEAADISKLRPFE